MTGPADDASGAGFPLSGRTVLIADDDPLLLSVLALRCRSLGARTVTAGNGAEALDQAAASPPDLVILDINMSSLDGFEVQSILADDPQLRSVPVIFVSGRSDEPALRECEALRCHHVLKGHDTWEQVREIIVRLFPGPATDDDDPAARPTIMLVDDDRDLLRAISIRLRKHGFDVVQAANGIDGYWRAVEERPDVIVTDCTMPGGSGEYMISRLKDDQTTALIPVVVLTGWSFHGRLDVGHQREFTGRCGAVAYLRKPLDFAELLNTLSAHVRHRRQHG